MNVPLDKIGGDYNIAERNVNILRRHNRWWVGLGRVCILPVLSLR